VAISLARAKMVDRYQASEQRKQQQRRRRRRREAASTLHDRERPAVVAHAAVASQRPAAEGAAAWSGWPEPVRFTHSGADISLNDGGSVASYVGGGCYASVVCGAPMKFDQYSQGNGQYYVEMTWLTRGSGAVLCAGVAGESFDPAACSNCAAHASTDAWMYDAGWSGYLWGAEGGTATRTSWEGMQPAKLGDRIGLLLDLSESTLAVFINGEPLGTMARGLKGPLHWAIDLAGEGTSVRIASAPLPSLELQIQQTLMGTHVTVSNACSLSLSVSSPLSAAIAGATIPAVHVTLTCM
jgi:hypothetical protein